VYRLIANWYVIFLLWYNNRYNKQAFPHVVQMELLCSCRTDSKLSETSDVIPDNVPTPIGSIAVAYDS